MPAGLLALAVVVVLKHYSVSYWELTRFGLYLALGVILPGTLIWRAITKRAYALVEEVAAGTAVGFALEVLTYIPARAVGAPLAVLVWPAATLLTFALRRDLRKYWRSHQRAPAWYSWSLSALTGLIFLYCVAAYFRVSGLHQPGYGITDSDTPWYLANIGEFRHHVPPMYLVLVCLTVILGVILILLPRTRAAAPLLIVAVVMGMGLEPSVHDRLADPVRVAITDGWEQSSPGFISEGTLEVGRWIRDHSAPSDLVAINGHCLFPSEPCLNARFGATAFTERRVLIEGWRYSPTVHEISRETGIFHMYVPYWDPTLLAINDAAFAAPSALTVWRLRDEYGRWLFVDRSINPPAGNLGDFAELRFASGTCEVYEVPGG